MRKPDNALRELIGSEQEAAQYEFIPERNLIISVNIIDGLYFYDYKTHQEDYLECNENACAVGYEPTRKQLLASFEGRCSGMMFFDAGFVQ